ncbi:hypothetical protein [Thermoflavimicrobium dichotomicum]|uniref:Uncharacterized protein n=1 Tax=Thermoflavimicrobium dichotomicum TaxID=46223 RepID=A0A1I3LVA1_9BACL|nr:hypothetical protein [Thermoflavimicrobium dichotomicum]SFI88691.1 hypothetical protein SAMN05421852_102336 [Thermoflavimicrobium dichotomicum]
MVEIIRILFGRLIRFLLSRQFLALFLLRREDWTISNGLRVLSHYLVPILFFGALFMFQNEEYSSSFTDFYHRHTTFEWSRIFLVWLALPFIVWLCYFVAKKLEQKDPAIDKRKEIQREQEIAFHTENPGEVKTILLHEDDYHQFKQGLDGKVPQIVRVEKASSEEWEDYQKRHPYRSYYSPNAVIKVYYTEMDDWKKVKKKEWG